MTIRVMGGLVLSLSLCACGQVVVTVDDALVREDARRTTLTAYVEVEHVFGLRYDLSKASVEFLMDGRRAGVAETDADGAARIECPVAPAGGPREFVARVRHGGRDAQAVGYLHVWSARRTMIAVDIDKTIADTDYDHLVLKPKDTDSEPIKGSRKTLERLSGRYDILYLTARPRFLKEKTRRWLIDRKFPDGALVTAQGLRASSRARRFKESELNRLRRECPNLLIGIGNKESDAEAYRSHDMLTFLVDSKGNETDDGVVEFDDWKKVDRYFQQHDRTLSAPDRLRSALARPDGGGLWGDAAGAADDDD